MSIELIAVIITGVVSGFDLLCVVQADVGVIVVVHTLSMMRPPTHHVIMRRSIVRTNKVSWKISFI